MKEKIKRISNVSVLAVELTTGRLTVWRKKHEPERMVDVLTTFFLAKDVQVKDAHGYIIPFSKIKPGSRVTIDYVKQEDGRFIASNIAVAKLYGGEGDG